MPSPYFDQDYVVRSAQIMIALGRYALTLSQLNNNLTDPATSAELALGAKQGWLLFQPGSRYQVNPNMDKQNWWNRLIGSFSPNQVSISTTGELPATFVQGLGLTTASDLDLAACGDLDLDIPSGPEADDPLSVPPPVGIYDPTFVPLRVCSSKVLKSNIKPLLLTRL
jgi:hypothetical protein